MFETASENSSHFRESSLLWNKKLLDIPAKSYQ